MDFRFSVAWYPIYRIPERNFRASFLTYHSLGHFAQRPFPTDASNEHTSQILSPVLGLQSYNAQVRNRHSLSLMFCIFFNITLICESDEQHEYSEQYKKLCSVTVWKCGNPIGWLAVTIILRVLPYCWDI